MKLRAFSPSVVTMILFLGCSDADHMLANALESRSNAGTAGHSQAEASSGGGDRDPGQNAAGTPESGEDDGTGGLPMGTGGTGGSRIGTGGAGGLPVVGGGPGLPVGVGGSGGSPATSGGGTGGGPSCDDGSLVIETANNLNLWCNGDTASGGAMYLEPCEANEVLAEPCENGELPLGKLLCNRAGATDLTVGTAHWVNSLLMHPEFDYCDSRQREELYIHVSNLNPCERPPICLPDGGTWGCDQVTAACPAIPAAECQNAVWSRRPSGNLRLKECLEKSEGSDCHANFQICAWGFTREP